MAPFDDMTRVQRIVGFLAVVVLPLLFIGLSALVLENFGEGVYVLGVGIITTVLSGMTARASLAKRSWPKTNGVVTHAEVKTTPGLFGWRDTDQDRVRVDYSYTVEGEEHAGCFWFHPTEDQALRQLGGFPKQGSPLAVHYNPKNPVESSVIMGPGMLNLCFLLLGLAGIVGGFLLIWK